MKRSLALMLCALLFALSFTGCKKSDSDESQSTQPATTVSMYDLSKAMETAAGFTGMNYRSNSDDAPEDAFSYISSMNYEKVAAFFVSYASNKENPNADELCVIAVKDASDAAEAESTLRQHQQKRVSQYASYAPKQVPKVESGLVFTEGQYAVLIISDSNDAVKQAFLDFVR